ncbi:HmuY family protein [Pedobacter agri]|uniref:HmuY family protein n=1 Tax=Pedobacter agri TaxID=454586 RepID=UPI00292DC7BD|nr:HmuY family protein [Pedobacter agri]
MNKLNSMIAIAALAITFTACKKTTEEPIIVVPPSDGATLTLSGKTAESNYANIVFADLSTDKSTPVDRKSFNFGLTSDSRFRVVLNAAYQTTAVSTSKTDIAAVTVADPGTTVNLNHDITDASTATLVDNWDGDISKTAIPEISVTDADNKVFLISFEGSKDKDKWFKVRITRNGTGYKVQYARLSETAIKTLDVAKSSDFNLVFVSLENNKTVTVEPKKTDWDFSWSYGTYNSGLGSPYWFQDYIATNNLAGVSAAEVVATSSLTYASFAESNISGLAFLNTRDAIGSKWRSTTGTGIKTDRFYVVKDGAGNIYKLRFVSMGVGSDGGERGKPVFEYKLVKKG